MRTPTGLALAVLLVGAGCAGPDTASIDGENGGEAAAGEFRVPPLRVGSVLRYYIGFATDDFAFGGPADVKVVSQASVPDASGFMREAFLLRQGDPKTNFWEDYWVDARTYRQIQLLRNDNYTEKTRLTPPAPAFPPKTTYANGTGPLERNLEDPLFEDANFFGIFASDRALPLGVPFNVSGNLWKRGETDLLERGNWTATPEAVAATHERWGDLRSVSFEAEWRQGNNFETIEWTGSFSALAPLAVDAERALLAQFGTEKIEVKLNATLLSYDAGDGKEIRRESEPLPPPPGKLARGPAEQFPAGAADARLGFPFQEAVDKLKLDPTASQFFSTHTGSYVRYAHMSEVDTCGFFPQSSYPGCHWSAWFGVFAAPDDFEMRFVVEKYHGGGASVSFTPIIPTEDIMDILFEAAQGETPTGPPPMAVVVTKAATDLPPRNAYPMDALTFAAAADAFLAGAKGQNANRAPNMVAFFMTPSGYEFFLSHYQWVFPPEPELFPLYDDMPLELERHTMEFDGLGRILSNQNYDLEIVHK